MEKKGFFSRVVQDVVTKRPLFALLKKINSTIDGHEFYEIIEKNNYSHLLNSKYYKYDANGVKTLFDAYYLFAKNQYEKSFISSFFLIEYLLRKTYDGTDQARETVKVSELLKRAQNRNMISQKNTSYIFGFKEVRNKNVHGLNNCSEEEAKLILKIATEIFDDFQKLIV